VIPKFINNILNGKSPVIFGYGKQTRDFIFIKDVVNANILAAEKNIAGVYNIASGKSISIQKLAETLLKINNKKTEIIYDKPRPGDILDSLADISKIKKQGFTPKYRLDEGLKESVKWFSK